MKINLQFLRKFAKLDISAKKIANMYTQAGLEVKSIEREILDITIPPNRADCLSFQGLAREAAALTNSIFKNPKIELAIEEDMIDTMEVEVLNQAVCPKYLMCVIKNIKNNFLTPQYIRDVLETANISCISPIIDITNYVMLETGQPLHAFDKERINGKISVRFAKYNEKISLLGDELSYRNLQKNMLVIADQIKVLSVAGIIGGNDSKIISHTKDIILECAYFDPINIRLTSRNLGIQTDASYRFERSIDPNMQLEAIKYAIKLILKICGGHRGPISTTEEKTFLPKPVNITLRVKRLNNILGMNFTLSDCIQILRSLGMDIIHTTNLASIIVKIPSFRQDIKYEIDLIEEIARIYGYDNLPANPTMSILEFSPRSEKNLEEIDILRCLNNRGYNEAITYSFIDSRLSKDFHDKVNDLWWLKNPISIDMNLMRFSLLPGLVKAISYNFKRQQSRIRLFEIGLIFLGEHNNLRQMKTIAGACTGNYLKENWNNSNRTVDFYDIKQDVISLFNLSNIEYKLKFLPAHNIALQPEESADIMIADNKVGIIGALNSKLQKKLDIEQPIYVFSVDYNSVTKGQLSNFKIFSKYLSVQRDIAVLVNKELSVAELKNVVRKQLDNLMTELVIFDVYEGKGIDKGKKSIGLRIKLNNSKTTLKENEVNAIFEKILLILKKKFHAILR